MPKCKTAENPWDRQPGETAQAYGAFREYLALGEKRSCAKVGQKLGKSRTLMNRWSSTWNWVDRSRAYDTEKQRQDLLEEQEETKKMRDRQIKTAMLLQKKAVQALDNLDIEDLPPKDILRFISVGAELERRNREDSTADMTRETGGAGPGASLADTIIAAYKKRTEGGE